MIGSGPPSEDPVLRSPTEATFRPEVETKSDDYVKTNTLRLRMNRNRPTDIDIASAEASPDILSINKIALRYYTDYMEGQTVSSSDWHRAEVISRQTELLRRTRWDSEPSGLSPLSDIRCGVDTTADTIGGGPVIVSCVAFNRVLKECAVHTSKVIRRGRWRSLIIGSVPQRAMDTHQRLVMTCDAPRRSERIASTSTVSSVTTYRWRRRRARRCTTVGYYV